MRRAPAATSRPRAGSPETGHAARAAEVFGGRSRAASVAIYGHAAVNAPQMRLLRVFMAGAFHVDGLRCLSGWIL